MSGLEFEQKFVLDTRHAQTIREQLQIRVIHGQSGDVSWIRQFYDKDGGRCRDTYFPAKDEHVYLLESKKSIKLGTQYSITQEQDQPLSADDFEWGWEKNVSRRLQKTRYTTSGRYPDHSIMIDFFWTNSSKYEDWNLKGKDDVYAVIAEAETMLTPDTTTLYLHFSLPIYLERYRLLTVDDSDPEMRVFKSANMVDQPDSIEAVKRAIGRLYD